jgi:hypothetical protein
VEKLVYISWRDGSIDIEAYRERLLGDAAKRILDLPARALTIQVADLDLPPQAFLGQGATIAAAVSLWLDSLDARGPVEAALADAGGRVDGYLVTESIPQACADRDWPDGERSPGVTQFVAFPKPDRLSDEAFFRGWHEEHTPFSFELHPTRWSYTRNAVARVLTPGAPAFRAIVEERWRSLEEWLDPDQLFGSPELLARAREETVHYVDFEALHQSVMSEYILRSAMPASSSQGARP